MHPAMTPPHPESPSINVYDLLSCRVRGKAPSDARAAVLQGLDKMKRLADKAGHYRYALPKEFGGKDGTNLAMAIIRDEVMFEVYLNNPRVVPPNELLTEICLPLQPA